MHCKAPPQQTKENPMPGLTQIVETLYANFGDGNVGAIAEVIAEDIEWIH